MKLPIPGPADLVHAASAVRDGVEDALALIPRLVTVLDRVESLLDLYEPPLTKLAPSLRTFTEKLDPAEVTAMIELVDRLPRLLTHLDEDVLPILTTLDRVAPDLHQLLEIAQDLQVALGGLPGMGWVRKRAEKEEEEAEQLAAEIEGATLKPLGKPKVKAKPKAGS